MLSLTTSDLRWLVYSTNTGKRSGRTNRINLSSRNRFLYKRIDFDELVDASEAYTSPTLLTRFKLRKHPSFGDEPQSGQRLIVPALIQFMRTVGFPVLAAGPTYAGALFATVDSGDFGIGLGARTSIPVMAVTMASFIRPSLTAPLPTRVHGFTGCNRMRTTAPIWRWLIRGSRRHSRLFTLGFSMVTGPEGQGGREFGQCKRWKQFGSTLTRMHPEQNKVMHALPEPPEQIGLLPTP
jgi:hypothetical protein